MTEEGRKAASIYQKTTRIRSVEELNTLQENTILRNKEQFTCLHCKKAGSKPVIIQWHFENCLENPTVCEGTLNNRRQLRLRFQLLNKNNKENNKENNKDIS